MNAQDLLDALAEQRNEAMNRIAKLMAENAALKRELEKKDDGVQDGADPGGLPEVPRPDAGA